MGTINFLTDVDKTVDIDKTVDLTVNKSVFSNVTLDGSLATAEASADAVGGSGGGGGGEIIVRFDVDDFMDTDLIVANAVADPPGNPVTGAPVALTSDIPGFTRTLHTTVLSDEGSANLGVDNPLLAKLAFDQGNNTYSNAYADYLGGPIDAFPDADNDDILADFFSKVDPDTGALVEELCYTYRFDDIDWDPGTAVDGEPATLRVSLLVEDADGDQAITTVAFTPGDDGAGFQDLQINGIVAAFLDPTIIPAGTVIDADTNNAQIVVIGTDADVDGDGNPAEPGNASGGVDFNDLVAFQILLEDDPTVAVGTNAFSSADFFALDSVIDEHPSIDGSDASVSDFTFTRCEFEDNFGRLAETDTFAQVEPDGAFSFSESLAALSATDEMIFV